MNVTKNYLYGLLLITTLLGACSKASSDSYVSTIRTGVSASGGTSARTPTTPVYAISFNNADQIVKVSLINKTLSMNFYENINLYARKDSLGASWSIIFTENFKATQLGKFNYTTVGKSGTVTTNYAESNLNNMAISAMKDTAINNLAYTKISFARSFYFSNTYTSSTEAATQFDYMLNNKEVVIFSAYITTATNVSSTAKSNSNLVYSSN